MWARGWRRDSLWRVPDTAAQSTDLPADLRAAHDHVDRLVRVVPDFPRPGILFRDFTPLLADAVALSSVVGTLAREIDGMFRAGDGAEGGSWKIAGMEARGFMIGAPVALALGIGFVALRKPGKLPPPVRSESYALEYGSASLELGPATVAAGDRVVIVDDLLATGGTAAAATRLVRDAGARVAGCAFVMELGALHGRDRLGRLPVVSIATY